MEQGSSEEICRRIREEEPPTPSRKVGSTHSDKVATAANARRLEPSQLSSRLRGDLDWIVMKAIDKEPSRRYTTAEALAEDVERYLRGESVLAAPPTAVYRLRKFATRNKVLLSSLTTIATVLIAATVFSSWLAYRLQDEIAQKSTAVKVAEAAEQRARHLLYVNEMATAKREFDRINTRDVRALLDRQIPDLRAPDFRNFEWYWLRKQLDQELFRLEGHTFTLRDIKFSPRRKTTGDRCVGWLGPNVGNGHSQATLGEEGWEALQRCRHISRRQAPADDFVDLSQSKETIGEPCFGTSAIPHVQLSFVAFTSTA